MALRWFAPCIMLAGLFLAVQAQSPSPTKPANDTADLELVQRLIAARRDYQKTLELLRMHYIKSGDKERAHWAEEELIQFHRIPKQAFRLDLDVPPEPLRPKMNVPEANKLYTRAMSYKDHGWGNDYTDNQRRAEILFQEILNKYPECNKISDVAYQLGDIYESKAYRQYRRSAQYFERCFQWNDKTHFDARMRAARIYDRQLLERGRAMELYKEVTTHETDAKRIAEAEKRLADLAGNSR